MPSIVNVILGDIFINAMNYAVSSDEMMIMLWIDVGELANHPLTPVGTSKHATICTKSDFMSLDNSVTHLFVGSNCSDASLTILDLSRFLFLREFVAGDYSLSQASLVMRGMICVLSQFVGLSRVRWLSFGTEALTKCEYVVLESIDELL